MSPRLYALLVGIDEYPDPRHRLAGCINDVTRMERYLRARTAHERFDLQFEVLTNSQAGRDALIAAFRRLGPARAGDTVLFYFSGHGSQAMTAPELRPYEPDGLDETLVCWDSRSPGGWDLADKELAQMIAAAGAQGAHLLVILDCCHSGSGTRGPLQAANERRIETDARARPFDSYLFAATRGGSNAQTEGESGWHGPPDVPHVLLAACRAAETAKEVVFDGTACGLFTNYLLATLENAGDATTYQDLYKQTQALVLTHALEQTPQFEALNPDELRRPFLGGALAAPLAYYTVRHDPVLGWVMDGGAVHGIAAPRGEETTILALFAMSAGPDDLRQAAAMIGRAQVIEVQPHLSRLTLETAQPPDGNISNTYKALVIGLPLPPFTVTIEGDTLGCDLARQALQARPPEGKPSLYVREIDGRAGPQQPQLRLLAQNGEYCIARPQDARALVGEIVGYTAANAQQAIDRLEHIARWTQTAELRNPSSRIPSDALDVSILVGGRELPPGNLRLTYQQRGSGVWEQPAFRVRVKNRWRETLYCALVSLSEAYAVSTGLFPASVRLAPGEAATTPMLYGRVPDALWRQGVGERRDIVKLIASTTEFDPTLLIQPALDAPRPPITRDLPQPAGSLNRHLQRLQARDADEGGAAALFPDWVTGQIAYTVVRPLPAASPTHVQGARGGA